MARVSSRSGLVTAPQVMTTLIRPTTPQLIPQEPNDGVITFHGLWARRNHPLPYTKGQLVDITGVEDLPSAQVLLHHQPQVCQLARAVHNYNFLQPSQGLLLFPLNSIILIIMTVILAHPFGMKTSHQNTQLFHTFAATPTPSSNNQR